MKKDSEVKLYLQARKTGKSQKLAAAQAGMSERTGRKYERMGTLPSQLKQPRTWLTRKNPFEQDWDWVVAQLERDPALQATTLLALLIEQHPDRYRPTQIVTLRRHIARWRALHGPEREVIFEQVHTPGERAESDFTHMSDLGITIAGEPFPHLIYHMVFTYSNVEAVTLCFSESFEALAEGIEHALWQLGGVPKQHRTDHLTAAKRCACEAAASLPVGPTTGASCVIWLPGVTAAGRPAGMRSRQRFVRCPGSHWSPAKKCRCAFHASAQSMWAP